MIRTATEIERALEIVISNYNVTNGSVYSNGARPSNSTLQDVEIEVISGEVADNLLVGDIEIRTYVPDIQSSNSAELVKDCMTCWERELDAQLLVENMNAYVDGYCYFEQQEIIRTEKSEEKSEHIVVAKLQYKILNEN